MSIDGSPFADHIRRLDATSQAYFQNQFFTRQYAQTKQQIARRLYSVLRVPAFQRMFASKTNRLDMFEALQSGSVILINTSKALLKTDASALFGRYMIARVITAAFERIALPAAKRNPAFLVVDEAAEYFDENLETILSQARKFNVGVLFAHQHLDQLTPALRAAVAANTSIKLAGGVLDQLTPALRAAVAANTSIKLAGGVSDKDARALAPDMRTTSEFIGEMRKLAHSTEFACFVRNYTGSAVRLKIPFGALEKAQRMSPEQHARLIARNQQRYATLKDSPADAEPDDSLVRLHHPDLPWQLEKDGAATKPRRNDPDNQSSDAAEKW